MSEELKQIGWYDPGSQRFCYTDVKEHSSQDHSGYTIRVYADLQAQLSAFKEGNEKLQSRLTKIDADRNRLEALRIENEGEIEVLKKSREIAILEGKIPRQIVETVAKSLGVKTGIWVGAIEEKIDKLQAEMKGMEEALRKIADMSSDCGGGCGNYCCGCIGSAIATAEAALPQQEKKEVKCK